MRCVICGRNYPNQYGNNPYPVKTKGLCCNECNDMIVIPARITEYLKGGNTNGKRMDTRRHR